jgi:hypothetical protein
VKKSVKMLLPIAAAAVCVVPTAAAAQATAAAPRARAAHASSWHANHYKAGLKPIRINHSWATGWATVALRGHQAKVTVYAWGLPRNLPHAQHIHIGARGVCPSTKYATKHNGHRIITVTNAAPAYGAIGASLTTKGDASPASGLAVTRFPTAKHGYVSYHRTITVSANAAANIRRHRSVVVLHGVDYNHNGRYDNVLGKSELDPKLPQEATAPAACGSLHSQGWW